MDGGVGTAGDEARAVGETLGAVGECADQAGAPVGELVGVSVNGGEVVFFARVGFQIEELLGAVGRAPDVFVATVGERVEGLGGAVGVGVFGVERGAEGRGGTARRD